MNIQRIMIVMKEKVTQARSDTLGVKEREAIQQELLQLTDEISDIVGETQLNSVALIDGTYTGKSFQTGEGKADTLTFSIASGSSPADLNVASNQVANSVDNFNNAGTALDNVNNALTTIFNNLQTIGATIARLTFKEETLRIAIANTEATKSRILDSDIAFE